MTEVEALAVIRALFPTLMALSSLALVPLIRLWRGPQRDDAATYATFGVQRLLALAISQHSRLARSPSTLRSLVACWCCWAASSSQ